MEHTKDNTIELLKAVLSMPANHSNEEKARESAGDCFGAAFVNSKNDGVKMCEGSDSDAEGRNLEASAIFSNTMCVNTNNDELNFLKTLCKRDVDCATVGRSLINGTNFSVYGNQLSKTDIDMDYAIDSVEAACCQSATMPRNGINDSIASCKTVSEPAVGCYNHSSYWGASVLKYSSMYDDLGNRGLELSKALIEKAVKCDKEGRVLEAASLYRKGCEVLSEVDTVSAEKLKYLAMNYQNRSEQIYHNLSLASQNKKLVRTINIKQNTNGKSYEKLYKKYLNADVKEIIVVEPNLHNQYHLQNLIKFTETLIKMCPNVKYIKLVTKKADEGSSRQEKVFRALANDVTAHGAKFRILLATDVGKGTIILSNGYLIESDRGLHLFAPAAHNSMMGREYYEVRSCVDAKIEIYQIKNAKK